ncbi:hypothetical protein [Embleya sp. AB8]
MHNVMPRATRRPRPKAVLVVVGAAVSGVAKAVTAWLLDHLAG